MKCIKKLLLRLKIKKSGQLKPLSSTPDLIAKNTLLQEDYNKRLRLYQFTGNEQVFDPTYRVPDSVPETRGEYLKIKQSKPANSYDSVIMRLESAFASGNNLAIIAELKTELKDFELYMTKLTSYYLDNKNHINSRNLSLTFFLAKTYLNEFDCCVIANELLAFHPLSFTVSDLRFINSFAFVFYEINGDSPFLISYLANDFEKFRFYSEILGCAHVIYRSVKITSQDGPTALDRIVASTLVANKKYVGMKLIDVIALEHPELLEPVSDWN